jgi:hypothetical protein
VVSVTPRPRFTPGERTPGNHWTGGWVGPRAGLDAGAKRKILCPCRGSNPDRPARSQTLHCLSCHGSSIVMTCNKNYVGPTHISYYMFACLRRQKKRRLSEAVTSHPVYKSPCIFLLLQWFWFASLVSNNGLVYERYWNVIPKPRFRDTGSITVSPRKTDLNSYIRICIILWQRKCAVVSDYSTVDVRSTLPPSSCPWTSVPNLSGTST